MTTIPKVAASFETTLANKITSSATSMTLVTGVDDAGTTLSGTYGFVIDEGSANEEFVIGTVAGTAVSSMTRGLDPQNPSTEVSGLKFEHRRGATVKITDYPILGRLTRILNGDDTLPNKISYASHPTFSADTELVDKKYVDDSTNAGAANGSSTVKGIFEEATQAEIDADTAAGATGAELTINPVQLAASKYGTRLPSSGEKAALASTTTPSASNKYMSQSDTQKGVETYAADSVGSDAYAITLSPAIASYANGQVFRFKAGTANTGAATLAVNGLAAKAIVKNFNAALVTGDILAGQIVEVQYESVGDNFQMLSPTAISSPYGTGFGTWQTVSSQASGTVVQAATDLIIVVEESLLTDNHSIQVLTDASNPPTTLRGTARTSASGADHAGAFVPVKKGNYYKLVESSAAAMTYYIMTIS